MEIERFLNLGMVPEAQFALALLSVFVLLSVILSLFGCVCGCRKTTPKNELMGLAGMVKLTNPDENVNFSGAAPPVVRFDSVAASADHASEINKRAGVVGAGASAVGAGAVSSATRSLPDLPVDPRGAPDWEPAADTGSDLYATVEDNKLVGGQKRVGLPRDLPVESSRGYDSPNQTDSSLSPYTRVKHEHEHEHPYDQLKQTDEHPYAQVRANGKVGLNHAHAHAHDDANHQSPSSSSGTEGTDSPVAPPRALRKSLSDSQGSSVSSVVVAIPAASAIAGVVPASVELPYMTPPLPPPAPHQQQQQHFSGDSQDSSKGYTSISVREPLSKIRDQAATRRQETADPHYATVSDDSDEMYAAIEESNLYTSGSETYAQIQPKAPEVAPEVAPATSAVTPQPPVATAGTSGRTGENLQPPPVYDKQHSRQESVSSGGSSNVSPASPKPEKRQANSPLPRPPHPDNPNPPSVDDMYAKVMKKRRSSQSVSSATDQEPAPDGQPLPAAGYETVLRPHGEQSENSSAPGYETVANSCGNESTTLSSGYETVAGDHDSLVPGYERVAGGRDRPPSESSEPNYEELRPQQTYATVDKKRKTASRQNSSEPDYASLSRKDLGYERVEGFDSNYESSDPNYESVERQEAPYERVAAAYTPVYDQASGGGRDEGLRVEDVYSKVNKQLTVSANR